MKRMQRREKKKKILRKDAKVRETQVIREGRRNRAVNEMKRYKTRKNMNWRGTILTRKKDN